MFTIEIDGVLDRSGNSYPLRHARLLAEAISWDERCTVCVLNEAGRVVYEVGSF